MHKHTVAGSPDMANVFHLGSKNLCCSSIHHANLLTSFCWLIITLLCGLQITHLESEMSLHRQRVETVQSARDSVQALLDEARAHLAAQQATLGREQQQVRAGSTWLLVSNARAQDQCDRWTTYLLVCTHPHLAAKGCKVWDEIGFAILFKQEGDIADDWTICTHAVVLLSSVLHILICV